MDSSSVEQLVNLARFYLTMFLTMFKGLGLQLSVKAQGSVPCIYIIGEEVANVQFNSIPKSLGETSKNSTQITELIMEKWKREGRLLMDLGHGPTVI